MNYFFGSFFILLAYLTISGFKLDREYQQGVVFRLGRIQSVKGRVYIGLFQYLIKKFKWILEPKPLI